MIRATLIFGLALLIGACQASRQGESSDPATSQAQADTGSDSLRPAGVEPGPAPSTARVRATVQACRQEANGYRCMLKIREVVAYGSATPVLGVGAEIDVRVPEGRQDRESLPDGAEVEVTLSHSEQLASSGKTISSWTLVTIH